MNPEENKPLTEVLPEEEQATQQPEGQTMEQPEEQPAPPKGKTKTRKKPAPSADEDDEEQAFREIGLTAIAEHALAEALVTSDGQVFTQQCDARAHASTLQNQTIYTVKNEQANH